MFYGNKYWLEGQPKIARNCWKKSLASSNANLFTAMAHYELGRHSTGKERTLHLREAEKMFERASMFYYLKLTKKAMEQPSYPEIRTGKKSWGYFVLLSIMFIASLLRIVSVTTTKPPGRLTFLK